MRRVLRERRIGHTGTLDPLATGVLPLVIGRATRLARFLSGSEKSYEAVVRLGFATDSGDSEGSPLGTSFEGLWPTRSVIDEALSAFRGQFLQHPPAFSAKKIAGQRSYEMARRDVARTSEANAMYLRSASEVRPKTLAPVSVTLSKLEITDLNADHVSLTLTCSAGFYVRALAHDLGERLGTGAHLVALRRTRVGSVTLDDAVPLAAAEGDPAAAAARVIPMSRMLTDLPAMTLDSDAIRLAVSGRDLDSRVPNLSCRYVRLVDQAGDLVAIAEPAVSDARLLHPFVVLR
jgi:tRNA pseudouridine55 synthase